MKSSKKRELEQEIEELEKIIERLMIMLNNKKQDLIDIRG